jgi:hypothetical protein
MLSRNFSARPTLNTYKMATNPTAQTRLRKTSLRLPDRSPRALASSTLRSYTKATARPPDLGFITLGFGIFPRLSVPIREIRGKKFLNPLSGYSATTYRASDKLLWGLIIVAGSGSQFRGLAFTPASNRKSKILI